MENKIYFLGNSKDFILAKKLYEQVSDDLEVKLSVAVLESGYNLDTKYDAIACEFSQKPEVLGEKVYTYSVGQSNADICGFNFQKREFSRSVDLFSSSFMGRVNIPVNSEFTEKSVIYCVSGFVAAGVSLPQILKVINSKIS